MKKFLSFLLLIVLFSQPLYPFLGKIVREKSITKFLEKPENQECLQFGTGCSPLERRLMIMLNGITSFQIVEPAKNFLKSPEAMACKQFGFCSARAKWMIRALEGTLLLAGAVTLGLVQKKRREKREMVVERESTIALNDFKTAIELLQRAQSEDIKEAVSSLYVAAEKFRAVDPDLFKQIDNYSNELLFTDQVNVSTKNEIISDANNLLTQLNRLSDEQLKDEIYRSALITLQEKSKQAGEGLFLLSD